MKKQVSFDVCKSCGKPVPKFEVCKCSFKVKSKPSKPKKGKSHHQVKGGKDVQSIVKQWKDFKGFVIPSKVAISGIPKDVIKSVIFPQIKTIQGKGAVKIAFHEGKCSKCGKQIPDGVPFIIHSVDWSSKPSQKWKASGWDDFDVFCPKCAAKFCASRHKA